MIPLTRRDGTAIVVNVGHILTVEATPDTVLTLSTGDKLLLLETPDEIIARVTDYLRTLGGRAMPWVLPGANEEG